jgi:hypothetical protein
MSDNGQFHLTEVFEIALRLKAATLTTDYQYEFVVYPPGTPFKVQRNVLTGDGDIDQPNPDQNVGCQLWCQASIHKYISEPSIPRDLAVDALVQPNNFISTSEEKRKDKSLHSKFLLVVETEHTGMESISERPFAGAQDKTGGQALKTATQPASNVPKKNINRKAAVEPNSDDSYNDSDSSGAETNGSKASSWSKRHASAKNARAGYTKKPLAVEKLEASPKSNDRIECKNCGAGFTRRRNLTQHVNLSMSRDSLRVAALTACVIDKCRRCLQCNKTFRVSKLLKEHREAEHSAEKDATGAVQDGTKMKDSPVRKRAAPKQGSQDKIATPEGVNGDVKGDKDSEKRAKKRRTKSPVQESGPDSNPSTNKADRRSVDT